MTSRIVAAVLALITAALASMAIPLGVLTAAQDRRDFRDDTVAAAGTAANLAEEGIGDGSGGPLLGRAVRDLARRGDRVGVYDATGHEVAGAGPAPLAAAVLRAALRDPSPRSYPAAGRLTVTVPVRADGGRMVIGTVALSRPVATLTHRIVVLWTLIGAVSAVSLLAAVVIAVGLARWASRPITTLAEAARRLGDGDLETRAGIRSGPPEVRRLAAAFSTMAARLQALIRGHQAMVADVSHQVRTPLAALRLRLDLLAQDCDDATAAELAGAQEEIGRLTRLVNGLLTVARAEHSTAAPARVAVAAVAADRAAAWRGRAAEERGVTLTAGSPAPVSARAVDGHLEQILDNLLANALEAVPPGGTITVTTAARAATARLAVADTGRGMTGAQQKAAFRRFSSGSPGGTGLGLAIVDRLVTANGGTVSLADTPGGGLTVTVDLPLSASPAPAGRSAAGTGSGPAGLNQS